MNLSLTNSKKKTLQFIIINMKNFSITEQPFLNTKPLDKLELGQSIQIMLDEVGSMFDQAVVTDIRDLHIGNMGFKKNDQNKWQLIFTDIDSK